MAGSTIEWAVMAPGDPDPHRGPMSKIEAEQWVREWLDDGGKDDVFSIAYREVGPWVAPPMGVLVEIR